MLVYLRVHFTTICFPQNLCKSTDGGDGLGAAVAPSGVLLLRSARDGEHPFRAGATLGYPRCGAPGADSVQLVYKSNN